MNKEKTKWIKISEDQVKFVQKIADERFEGNWSMAIRFILKEVMKKSPWEIEQRWPSIERNGSGGSTR